jgi:alpha-tubulin suppressor-like RCC1 family protein
MKRQSLSSLQRKLARRNSYGLLLAVCLLIGLAGCDKTLTVRALGNGAGTVTGNPSGINCGDAGSACSQTTDQSTTIALTPTASPGSRFTGWGGDCTGTGTCSVPMDSDKKVHAFFQPVVAAGLAHTCAVRSNGLVSCWGRNSDGQIGTGPSSAPVTTPNDVSGIPVATAVATGGYHTCALLSTGTVSCWGLNSEGQLGNGAAGQGLRSATPVTVARTTAGLVVAIAAGAYHSCALLSNGVIECWGLNNSGQIGNGSVGGSPVRTPTPVSGISTAVGITAGGFHTCAILADNTVKCWGRNADYELSIIGSDSGTPSRVPPQAVPTLTPPDITTAVYISGGIGVGVLGTAQLGGYHTCAILSGGTTTCWGYRFNGVLGDGTNVQPTSPVSFGFVHPSSITLSGSARMVAGGAYHNCVLIVGGNIQCWGLGDNGQLGVNLTGSTGSPTTATLPTGRTAVAIAAGGFHTCALFVPVATGPNEMWCWGLNADGELGTGPLTQSPFPLRVTGFRP